MAKAKQESWDLIVIGAGASGMMAAITAAREKKSVLILEHKDKIGKKLYATGNGRCNFTNDDMDYGHFYGNPKLVAAVLQQFSKADVLDFFREIGIYPKNKNGYYYPNSLTAASVVSALAMEMRRLGVETQKSCHITEIVKKNNFRIRTQEGIFRAERLVFATGLLASPSLGSDGSAMSLIQQLGHGFTTIVPALCGLRGCGLEFKKVSGVRCEVQIQIEVGEEIVRTEFGELQLTDYGVSGIVVFQVSRIAALALERHQKPLLHIDFCPELSAEALESELKRRILRCAEDPKDRVPSVEALLNGLWNGKLIPVFLSKAKIPIQMPASELSGRQIQKLISVVKNCTIHIDGTKGYDQAQVCAGGIRTEEINIHTLESRHIPGLYFAGELLDVDGVCGGYNLQWAWASGYVAGKLL